MGNDKVLIFLMACIGPLFASAGQLKIIDPSPKANFESERLEWMKGKISSCKTCQIENLTPYAEDGQFQAEKVFEILGKTNMKDSILVVNWNRPFLKTDSTILEQIQKLHSEGVLIVASAGKPKDGDSILPLGKTLWGQSKEVLVVGELAEKEKLVAGSFFGPEMLTALGPKDLELGEGTGALAFSIKMLPQFGQKKNTEWITALREKRAKTRRLWPSLRDFFGH